MYGRTHFGGMSCEFLSGRSGIEFIDRLHVIERVEFLVFVGIELYEIRPEIIDNSCRRSFVVGQGKVDVFPADCDCLNH